MWRLLLLSSVPAAALTLRAPQPPSYDVNPTGRMSCDDGISFLQKAGWGVWIDGRDGEKGRDAYGREYSADMEKRLTGLYKRAASAGPELRTADWEYITKNREMRQYPTPLQEEVKTCHKRAFKKERIDEIFDHILFMDRKYQDSFDPFHAAPSRYHWWIKTLIRQYNQNITSAQTRDQKLHAIAFLMRNLAFLHPLRDMNGRSRMLLTQFELRRNRIACGCMMFNNNKDIYFQTEGEFVEKLKEGIEMYEQAAVTGLNPWVFKHQVTLHLERFPDPHRDALTHCWHHFCNVDENDHSVDRHGANACVGTAIALQRKRPEHLIFQSVTPEEELDATL